jgi:hypothetical protein
MWPVTKEGITGIVRTMMPYVYSFLLTTFGLDVSEEVGLALIPLLGTVFYIGIRWIAEKYPQAGYLLVVNKAPSYAENEGPTEF